MSNDKQTCQVCKNDRFTEEMHRCSYCNKKACQDCLYVVPYGGDVQFCRGGDCELEYLRNHYNDLRDEVEGQLRLLEPLESAMGISTLTIVIKTLKRKLGNE